MSYDIDGRSFFGERMHFDIYGRPVYGYNYAVDDPKWVDPRNQRSKFSHPHSYSEFFHFGSREIIKGRPAYYSDRLWQWDHQKYDKLWEEHVGCRFDQANQKKLSDFLSAYWGKKLEVVAMAEGCNPSNGYPYFIVWYEEKS